MFFNYISEFCIDDCECVQCGTVKHVNGTLLLHKCQVKEVIAAKESICQKHFLKQITYSGFIICIFVIIPH